MQITRKTLAEQVAADLIEQVLSGKLMAASALPTEPELASQYGVSRSVVRDATRLLIARGLVEVQHGRGIFVTASQRRAVSDALHLALRRDGATVWDLEELDRVLFPAAVSMAIERATESDIATIRELCQCYVEERRAAIDSGVELAASSSLVQSIRAAMVSFGNLLRAVYAATHNVAFMHFGELLIELRSWREWTQLDPQEDLEADMTFFDVLLEALESGDPEQARAMVSSPYQHQPEAIESMRQTPIGEIVRIEQAEASIRRLKPSKEDT